MDEVTRLARRVEELERRLAEVEERVGVERRPPVAAPVVPSPEVPVDVPTARPTLPPPIPVEALRPPPTEPKAEPRPEPQPPRFDLPKAARAETGVETGVETKAGLVWLNRIGAVTLILAVAFGFKAAVDNDLIGPAGRILCGLLAGALTIFAGDKLWHRGHKLYAQGITALGVCIFYLTFYAAFQLYHLVDQTVAFGGAIATTAAAGALALRYNARVIAILALLGGYLSPFLVATGQPNDPFFGSYMVALNAIALTLARRKRWLSVELTAAVCTTLIHAIWIAVRAKEIGPILGGTVATLQYFIFALSPYSWIRLAAAFPAMLAVAVLCETYSSPVFWPCAAAIALGGLYLAHREGDDRGIAASLGAWILGLLAWTPSYAPHGALFAGATAGFLTYFGALLALRPEHRTYSGYGALVLNGLFYYGFCYGWFDDRHHAYMGLLALAVAACYLAAALYLKKQEGAPPEMLLVAAGVALSFVTLAIPIQLSGYSITLAWAVECAALAYLGARFQSVWPFSASWLVGFLAIASVLSVDSQRAWGKDYSPLVNARFIPYLVVTICLALNAYWTRLHRGMAAFVPLLSAHFILLTGLHLEVFAWIGAGHRPEDDLTSQQAVASTILLALYGLALVAHGIAKNFLLHRWLGLAVFGIVIAKLYLFDIWQLNWLYKVLAFGGLGALLLSGSYLYSRYRNRLLALLKEEPPSE